MPQTPQPGTVEWYKAQLKGGAGTPTPTALPTPATAAKPGTVEWYKAQLKGTTAPQAAPTTPTPTQPTQPARLTATTQTYPQAREPFTTTQQRDWNAIQLPQAGWSDMSLQEYMEAEPTALAAASPLGKAVGSLVGENVPPWLRYAAWHYGRMGQRVAEGFLAPWERRAGEEIEKPGWKRAAQRDPTGILTALESVASGGLELLQEPARAVEAALAAPALLRQAKEQGVTAAQVAPLGEVGYSIARREAATKGLAGYTGKANRALAPTLSPNQAKQAVARIKAGEDPAMVRNELYDPAAEMVAESLLDPLQILDYIALAGKVKGATRAVALREVAQRAGKDPAYVDKLARLMDEWQELKKAPPGMVPKGGSRFVQHLKSLFTLVPEAKAHKIVSDAWDVLGGPLTEAKNVDDALALVRAWADNPESLVPALGQSVVSPAGKATSIALKAIAKDLDSLPVVKVQKAVGLVPPGAAEAVPEQAFNPAQFLLQLSDQMELATREAYGVLPKGAYERFIGNFKAAFSELWLNPVFNPAYTVRNMLSEVTTQLWEGINPFSGRKQIDKWLSDLGVSTQHIETRGAKAMEEMGLRGTRVGVKEGETPGQLVAEVKSILPGRAGQISAWGMRQNRMAEIAGRIPVGEERRIERTFVDQTRKFHRANWRTSTPPLPPAIAAKYGRRADDLYTGVGQGLTMAEKWRFANAWLDAKAPGKAISVAKYLGADELLDMEPAVVVRIQEELGKLPAKASRSEIKTALNTVRREVREDWAERTQKLIDAAERKTATEATEAEIVADAKRARREAVEEIDDPNLKAKMKARADEADARTAQREGEIETARRGLVEDLKAAPDQVDWPQVSAILVNANKRYNEALLAWRKTADEALDRAVKEYRKFKREGPQAARHPDIIWDEYYQFVDNGWSALYDQRAGIYPAVREQLARIRSGEKAEDVLAGIDIDVGAREIQDALADVPIPERAKPWVSGSMLDEEEARIFKERLGQNRANVDGHRRAAMRAMVAAEPDNFPDCLDFVTDAFDAEQRTGTLTAVTARRNKDEMLAAVARATTAAQVRRIMKEYYTKQEMLWRRYFDWAATRWTQAEGDVLLRSFPTEPTRRLPLGVAPAVDNSPERMERVRQAAMKHPTERTPEDVALLDEHISAAQRNDHLTAVGTPGYAPPPNLRDAADESMRRTLAALDKIEEGVAGEWDTWAPAAADAADRRALEGWMRQVQPKFYDHRAAMVRYGRMRADEVQLDYQNIRGFDRLLSYIFPYHYWYTRAGYNWARRTATRPWFAMSVMRTKRAMQQANENAGRRQRFGGKVEIPAPWLPDWMGNSLYVDPMSALIPFSSLYGRDWDDSDEARKGLRWLVEGMKSVGFRPYPFMELPYSSGALARAGQELGLPKETAETYLGPEIRGEVSYQLPMTQGIQAATAALRGAGVKGIPPGGVSVEGPLRTMLSGVRRTGTWEPYQISRMLSSMAGDDPQNVELATTALHAQQLIDADQTGYEQTWREGSAAAQDVAARWRWTPEQLTAAQQMLQTAMQRAEMERGLLGLSSQLTGFPAAIETTGEAAQVGLQRQAAGQRWAPPEATGGYEQYSQFKREYPAIYPRITQYQAMPGEETMGMEPAARANWIALKTARERIYQQFDAQQDAHLRRRPWDTGALSGLYDAREKALEAAEERWPLPEFDPNSMPTVIQGMNPGEAADAQREKVAQPYIDTRPQYEDCVDTYGDPDWDRYNQAMEKWRASIPGTTPLVAGLLGQGGTFDNLSLPQLVEAIRVQNHTPLRAAAEVYNDTVSGPAWGAAAEMAEQTHTNKQGKVVKWGWANAKKEHIETVPAMPAGQLIPAILRAYPARGWTAATLRQALAGVIFPPLADQEKDVTITWPELGSQPATQGATPASPWVPPSGGTPNFGWSWQNQP